MKKLLLLLSLSPVCAFAQAPASSNGDFFGLILGGIVLFIAVFFICRELICWYYKINKMVSNQDEIIRLLKKIANENNDPLNNTKLGEKGKESGILKDLVNTSGFMVVDK